jgi:hypothetical protein
MKRYAWALALLPAALTLASGCGCSAWEGRGDTLYRSAAGDSVMLCANGGFSATVKTANLEGVFEWNDEIRAEDPETGARVFSMAADATGAMTSPELGAGWTVATLDQVELDHAHVMCSDLETRAWWGTANMTAFLPKAAAFKTLAAGFASVDACHEAQAGGEYPAAALCEDELLVCPSGAAKLDRGQTLAVGSYDAQFGKLSIRPDPTSFMDAFEGVFSTSGTLTSHTAGGSNVIWHQVPVAEMSNGTSCM